MTSEWHPIIEQSSIVHSYSTLKLILIYGHREQNKFEDYLSTVILLVLIVYDAKVFSVFQVRFKPLDPGT